MPTTQEKALSLRTAIEIVKEYARGGSSSSLDAVLESVYSRLNALKDDIKKED